MRFVFWSAFALVAYAYLGYPAWLWLRGYLRPRPVSRGSFVPFVSIVLVVRNEEQVLARKLNNLLALNYPVEQTEIVIVSDGSSDGTNRILSEFTQSPRFRVILNQTPAGKAAGLSQAIEKARGEVVVFTDARQQIAENAIRLLMENFADQSVGCVSGELQLGDPSTGEVVRGIGMYWKIERSIRERESASGSVVGATGALYAARRGLLLPLPQDAILDDVFVPMQIVRLGKRVVLDTRAKVWDNPDLGARREFARKVRTLTGVYQLVKFEPWILSSANPMRFEFVSHKLFRLAVPFALCAALLSSAFLGSTMYRFALALQVAFYGLGTLGIWVAGESVLPKMAKAAFTFLLLNAAAVIAFFNFMTGRRPAWNR